MADVQQRAEGGPLAHVAAQQAVAVELLIGRPQVLEAEPHRARDVRVVRQAVVGEAQVRGLGRLADAGGLLARARAARARGRRRGPAELGHDDRLGAVAMCLHHGVHLAEAEEAVLPDPAVGPAVVRVGRGDAAGGVGVDGDRVERAARAVGVEALEVLIVVADERPGVHLRGRVGRLDRGVGGLEQRCVGVVAGLRAVPELGAVGLVPDLPAGDAAAVVHREHAQEPGVAGRVGRRREAIRAAGPRRRSEHDDHDLDAGRRCRGGQLVQAGDRPRGPRAGGDRLDLVPADEGPHHLRARELGLRDRLRGRQSVDVQAHLGALRGRRERHGAEHREGEQGDGAAASVHVEVVGRCGAGRKGGSPDVRCGDRQEVPGPARRFRA